LATLVNKALFAGIEPDSRKTLNERTFQTGGVRRVLRQARSAPMVHADMLARRVSCARKNDIASSSAH
jgi:hypothetical protein